MYVYYHDYSPLCRLGHPMHSKNNSCTQSESRLRDNKYPADKHTIITDHGVDAYKRGTVVVFRW